MMTGAACAFSGNWDQAMDEDSLTPHLINCGSSSQNTAPPSAQKIGHGSTRVFRLPKTIH